MQRSANRLCGRAALFYDHPIIIRLFSMPALSRTQEQLNFFSDLIAAATILATKALGEITLWPGFGVWRWSTATSPSNPHPAKARPSWPRFCPAKPVRGGRKTR
jgi:hypothetical protein